MTEFVLRLHPQRKTVYAGTVLFPGAVLEKVFAAAQHWFENDKNTKSSAIIAAVNPPPDREVNNMELAGRSRANSYHS